MWVGNTDNVYHFYSPLQRVQALNEYPDFSNYLAYVMSDLKTEADATRSLAGLILKNNVKEYYPR